MGRHECLVVFAQRLLETVGAPQDPPHLRLNDGRQGIEVPCEVHLQQRFVKAPSRREITLSTRKLTVRPLGASCYKKPSTRKRSPPRKALTENTIHRAPGSTAKPVPARLFTSRTVLTRLVRKS